MSTVEHGTRDGDLVFLAHDRSAPAVPTLGIFMDAEESTLTWRGPGWYAPSRIYYDRRWARWVLAWEPIGVRESEIQQEMRELASQLRAIRNKRAEGA